MVTLALVALFLWQATVAWTKYQKGDTFVVSSVEESNKFTFPDVSLCVTYKNVTPQRYPDVPDNATMVQLSKMLDDNYADFVISFDHGD